MFNYLANATRIDVGSAIDGEISTAFEKDFYQLHLTQGQRVSISLEGSGVSPLFDPTLELLDSSGKLIDFSSDLNGSNDRNAGIEFTPTETGIYYVDAYASGARTGAYSLSASTSAYAPTDGIDWGSKVYDSTIEVYFGRAGDYSGYVDDVYVNFAEAFTTYEKQQFWAAFALIESVTNLTFVETSTWYTSDFELYVDTDELGTYYGGLLGIFGTPNDPGAGIGMFNAAAWDRYGSIGSMELGGLDFTTVTHELLHGLGLAHPHDDGGTSDVFPGVYDDGYEYTPGDHYLNQGIFTNMSYTAGFQTIFGEFTESAASDYYDPNWGFEIGPMALDIAVLQEKYGANMTTATGDDVYVLPDENVAGTGWRAIWDAGGTDEIVYNGSRDIQIDLRAATLLQEDGGGGFISAAYDIAGGFTIANGVVIEIARGGAGDDDLFGNDAGNILYGGNGWDVITGGAGDDEIHGGNGADTIYMGAGDDIFHDNTQGTVAGKDLVYGGEGNDTFNGGWGDDTFYGGTGDDTIYGDHAFDYIDAGEGNDTVFGGTGMDEVYLGSGDDTFTDEKQFGWRAEDIVDGGDGNDTIIGYGGEDKLNGGSGDDDIIGGAGADTIRGGTGNDTLRGSWHDDMIYGEEGDDILTGGYQADTFFFEFDGGNDTITDLLASDGDMLLIHSGIVPDIEEFLSDGSATVTTEGVVLDLGDNGSITISNLDSLDGLADVVGTFDEVI
ncbi:MAG: pre-peptidase C-terminal domain-containing protein [Maritimibacter sp.]